MLNPLVGTSPAVAMCVGGNFSPTMVECLFDAEKIEVVCR